jgi:hypothetical protein
MRPIHRTDLRQDDSPPFWGEECFIRGCNEAAALRMILSASAFDSMMVNAGSDENAWLPHGRTYDNQRYSPLKQITANNVRSLSLASMNTAAIWPASRSTQSAFLYEGGIEGRWKKFLCQSSQIQSPLASDAMQSAASVASRWSAERGLHARARRECRRRRSYESRSQALPEQPRSPTFFRGWSSSRSAGFQPVVLAHHVER